MSTPIERLDETLKRMLSELSGRPVASAVAPIGQRVSLPPEEAALVAGAVEARRNEFAAGRVCARRALASLGRRAEPLPMGRLREPIWPTGYSGSITHDGGFAAALAYRSPAGRVWLSIDLVDAADCARFIEVEDTIRHPAEPVRHARDGHAIARLLSAKEAAIKIVSPAIGDFVDFQHLRAVETDQGFHVVAEFARLEIEVRTFGVDDIVVSLGLVEKS